MATPRITMRKLRAILRPRRAVYPSDPGRHQNQYWPYSKLIARLEALGLGWPLPDELDDNQLQQMLYPTSNNPNTERYKQPDCAEVHQSLKHKGVTLQLLWEEYADQFGTLAYSRTQFCGIYRRWRQQQKRSMRQVHKPGEKCFVDYCGSTMPIVNPNTGEVWECQVFVGVLGASNYTYADATLSQKLSDWLASHRRMLTFFGGTPAVVVPATDNTMACQHRK
ncbi:MAG: transposase [Candidatus Azotimanducaceae bacterium]|jgi:transposase